MKSASPTAHSEPATRVVAPDRRRGLEENCAMVCSLELPECQRMLACRVSEGRRQNGGGSLPQETAVSAKGGGWTPNITLGVRCVGLAREARNPSPVRERGWGEGPNGMISRGSRSLPEERHARGGGGTASSTSGFRSTTRECRDTRTTWCVRCALREVSNAGKWGYRKVGLQDEFKSSCHCERSEAIQRS